jgi:hypothetical protein
VVTTAIIKRYHNKPTQLLSCKDVALVVWGNKVTGNISGLLQFHTSKAVTRNYFQHRKRNKRASDCFEEVDWYHLDSALKDKAYMYKIRQSK